MKGIILLGGTGSRLWPVTYSTNKHLLPIYSKPMAYYSFSTLMMAGIREVLIIVDGASLQPMNRLFKDGSQWGMNIQYAIQEKPNGIAEAFTIGQDFIGEDDVMLSLGDNVFYGHGFPECLKKAIQRTKEFGGASIFAYRVNDPERYGVVDFDRTGRVLSLEEKPKHPRSNYAVPGIYVYDKTCVARVKKQKPSARGELEITDLNISYHHEDMLDVEVIPRGIAWLDTGTFDSLMDAGSFIQAIEKRQNLLVNCPEEIAYRNRWINTQQMIALADGMKQNAYSNYLREVIEEIKNEL